MNRIEIMEKLTQAADQMDERTLQSLAGWAEVLANSEGLAEIVGIVEDNERLVMERRMQRRQQKIQGASRGEQRILNRIERAKVRTGKASGAHFTLTEADFLIELSCNGPQLASDAYYLGFEKGYTAGKKAK